MRQDEVSTRVDAAGDTWLYRAIFLLGCFLRDIPKVFAKELVAQLG